MNQFTQLSVEFRTLKAEIFRDSPFIVLNQNDPKVRRYNQLLGFFYPQFRTSDWVNPMAKVVS